MLWNRLAACLSSALILGGLTEVIQAGSALRLWPKAASSRPIKIYPTLGAIERLDPALDALIPPGAVIERLAEGFEWAEGPVWIPRGKHLLFSDVPRNKIFKWVDGIDGVREYLDKSGNSGPSTRVGEPGSNGLTVDRSGRLLICQHGDRAVARIERDGSKTVLAEYYEFRRLNSPNDLVVHSSGEIYFTDPPYGLTQPAPDGSGQTIQPGKELMFHGVYRLTKTGQLILLTKEMTFPNGIALSPDEKTLYVANSDPAKAIWMAFDVLPNGNIANGRVLADMTAAVSSKKGLPDGLKVDLKGNLWATGPGGVLVFTPDGRHLGTINTGEATANCAWGEDGSVLYITADMYLCRVHTTARGKMPLR